MLYILAQRVGSSPKHRSMESLCAGSARHVLTCRCATGRGLSHITHMSLRCRAMGCFAADCLRRPASLTKHTQRDRQKGEGFGLLGMAADLVQTVDMYRAMSKPDGGKDHRSNCSKI